MWRTTGRSEGAVDRIRERQRAAAAAPDVPHLVIQLTSRVIQRLYHRNARAGSRAIPVGSAINKGVDALIVGRI
jgi:hypothetical protein